MHAGSTIRRIRAAVVKKEEQANRVALAQKIRASVKKQVELVVTKAEQPPKKKKKA